MSRLQNCIFCLIIIKVAQKTDYANMKKEEWNGLEERGKTVLVLEVCRESGGGGGYEGLNFKVILMLQFVQCF